MRRALTLTVLLAGMALAQGASADVALAVLEPQFYANNHLLGATAAPMFTWGQVTLQTSVGPVTCTLMLSGNIKNEGGQGVGEITGLTSGLCSDPELCKLVNPECHPLEPEREPTVHVTAEMPLRPNEVQEAEFCAEPGKAVINCPLESEREKATMAGHLRRRGSSFPWHAEMTEGTSLEEVDFLLRLGFRGATCYPKEKVIVEGKEEEVPVTWERVPAACVKLNVVVPQFPMELVYYGRLQPQLLNGTKNGLSPSRLAFNGGAEELELGGGRTLGKVTTGEDVVAKGIARVSGTLKMLGLASEELIVVRG
jgi:hypothetical protein